MVKESKDTTVLVAVLNKKDTIRACVESLLKLATPPAKIMVVDGYSKDGTYEILKSYEGKIDLYQYPKNLSKTFNWALDKIDTEYTALTDGDCVVDHRWLNELLEGFEEEGVVATAGYCGTPENLPLLPKMIGLELESRFKKFPKYINRAPTMNLCLRTAAAKKVRFDEKQMVGVEVDFCYRLLKLGRIIYVPEAKVWHYHRATLKNYFLQQKNQAKGGVRFFLKHGAKTISDHITTPTMSIQIPLFSLSLGVLLLSFVNQVFLWLFALLIFALLAAYLKTTMEISPPAKLYLPFLGLFFFRTLAWVTGAAESLIFSWFKFVKNIQPAKKKVK